MKIYFIGGSPCSGKSTAAEAVAEKHNLHYFKVDDHLNRYMELAAKAGKPCCKALAGMTSEQIWMRAPQVQCEEELLIYREVFEYILDDLNAIKCGKGIVTEGAAYLPALMKEQHVQHNRYISITPTKAFQVTHYSQREWVPYVLAGCSDKDKAFGNWMERDALFARAVQRQCSELGYVSLINDGTRSIGILIEEITAHFGLV